MDESDPDISFNEEGVCNHCIGFERSTRLGWYPNAEGQRRWTTTLGEIRAAGNDKEYDCIIGLSGGVDSSYVALKARDWGLRPLVVHVDGGWNSDIAVSNIEKVLRHCNYDLQTLVIDWEEMRDLQLAYLRAGVPNQDVPQDHAFFAGLYRFAIAKNIRYVLSGGNIATESIFPGAWHGPAMDEINLRSIHRRHGNRPLTNFPTVSFFQYYVWFPFVHKMRVVRPLNFMPYNKDQAIKELRETIGWRPYPRKHGESVFTKFFQNHYLVEKFGQDKRRPHLSSLIVAGQMSRDEALVQLQNPLYDDNELKIDISYLCKKLKISHAEYDELLSAPNQDHRAFPTWDSRYRALKAVQRAVSTITGKNLSAYS